MMMKALLRQLQIKHVMFWVKLSYVKSLIPTPLQLAGQQTFDDSNIISNAFFIFIGRWAADLFLIIGMAGCMLASTRFNSACSAEDSASSADTSSRASSFGALVAGSVMEFKIFMNSFFKYCILPPHPTFLQLKLILYPPIPIK